MFCGARRKKKKERELLEKQTKSEPTSPDESAPSSAKEVKTENASASAKDSKEVPKESKDVSKKSQIIAFTKAQLERWTSSINAVLADPSGRDTFREFLQCAETEPRELTRFLDFWEECEEYKVKFEELELKARMIFDKYLDVGADFEIPVDGADIEENVTKGFPQKSLFVEKQETIVKKLSETHYIHFVHSLKKKYKL